MAGILDLFSSQPNTGNSNADPLTPQNAAPQSLMQLLQGPQGLWPQSGVRQSNGPPYGDSGFAALQYQPSPELVARMLQLQSLMGVKEPQPPSPYGESGFASPGYAPTQEQAARQAALAQTFPASHNVVDLRQTPQFYPRQLPLQSMGTGLQNALIQNQQWPRPAQPQPPMMRYPGQ